MNYLTNVQKPLIQQVQKVNTKHSISQLKIDETDIPMRVFDALRGKKNNLIIVHSDTGTGKTVRLSEIIAQINLEKRQENESYDCVILQPFRISVKEMYQYLGVRSPNLNFGYAMRGDQKISGDDNSRLMTVGFWLEHFFANYRKNNGIVSRMIVVVDEAHDASWQTDLALRLLLFCQSEGAPIDIIISSATLDITKTLLNTKSEPLILTMPHKKANVKMNYHEKFIIPIENRKMSGQLFHEMFNKVKSSMTTYTKGDVLVLMPGQDEIECFIEALERDHYFDDINVYPLFSQMDKDDQQAAIKPDPEGKRKIIVTTNICENAITIEGIKITVDCGLRKMITIDSEGVTDLSLCLAPQSSMKQFAGRGGRLGEEGIAELLVTEKEFMQRPEYAQNEVQRNPLYSQIIKLVYNKFDVEKVLSHVKQDRIYDDIEYLVDHDCLKEIENQSFAVTDIGEIVTYLPLSVKAGRFLSEVLIQKTDMATIYVACVIAAWIDYKSTVFRRISKKPRESNFDFQLRMDELKDLQMSFYKSDCCLTMLNVWLQSWTYSENISFAKWCAKNGIYEKGLKDIQSSVNHIIASLSGMGLNVVSPNMTQHSDIADNIDSIYNELKPKLAKCFMQYTFVSSFQDNKYNKLGSFPFHKMNYHIDRSILDLYKGNLPANMIGLNVRKIGETHCVVSNIIVI